MALIFPNADTTTPTVILGTNFSRSTLFDVIFLSIFTSLTCIVYGV